MKKLLLAAAASAVLASPVAAQRVPQPSVAVVDTGRIYRDCTACRAATATLQTQIQQLNTRRTQLGQPIQSELQSIQQAAQAARNQQGAAAEATQRTLNQRLQTLQQRETTANQELQRLATNVQSTQANVARQINARLDPIISQVAQQRGANIAVDTQATLWAANTLDITDAVLAELNRQLPSVSVTPLPQQPGQQPAQQQQPRPQGR